MLSQVTRTNWLQFHRIELESPPSVRRSNRLRFRRIPINFLFKKEVPLSQHATIMNQWIHQCDGLVVFQSLSQIIVCNPATRELLTLPQSQNPDILVHNGNETDTIGFGFDRSTSKYKIVRVFYRSVNEIARSYSSGMEMFTLGGGSSNSTWRQMEDPPYPVLDRGVAHAHGSIYWIIWNKLHTFTPKAILCFNLSDEKFRLIGAPPPYQSDPLDFEMKVRLIDIQGNLFGLVHGYWDALLEKWTLSYTFK